MGTMEPFRFHDQTKHSPLSLRRRQEPLDWSNKPHPFKDYLELPSIPLPAASPDTDLPALHAVTEAPGDQRALGLEELARVLTLGAGVLREKVYPGGERFHFRTYASAGALYPIEIYLACAGGEWIDPGVYHFHPLEKSLRKIRSGDVRRYLIRATGGRESVVLAPVTVLLSGIPWRTTWKYDARGYRHLFWDAGEQVPGRCGRAGRRQGCLHALVAVSDTRLGVAVARGAERCATARGMDASVLYIAPGRWVTRRPEILSHAAQGNLVALCGALRDDIETVAALRDRGEGPSVIAAVGAGVHEFGRALGSRAEGVIGPSQWEPEDTSADVGPGASRMVAAYRDLHGSSPDSLAVQAWSCGVLAEAALDQVGPEPEDLWSWGHAFRRTHGLRRLQARLRGPAGRTPVATQALRSRVPRPPTVRSS